MKSPGLSLYSSMKKVCVPVRLRAASRLNSCKLTRRSSPPLTEKNSSIEATPKSSSARACVKTSSRFVAFVSRPGRSNETVGGMSSSAVTSYSFEPR